MRLRKIGIQPQGGPVFGQRFGRAAGHAGKRDREIHVRYSVIGAQTDRGTKLEDRIFDSPHLVQNNAEVKMGFRVVGTDLQRILEMGGCLGQSIRVTCERQGEIVFGFG